MYDFIFTVLYLKITYNRLKHSFYNSFIYTLNFTEMITTNTLVRTNEPERYLESNFNIEDPIVLQLGGSCPTDMRTASAMAKRVGFREININAGCPSEKVSGVCVREREGCV